MRKRTTFPTYVPSGNTKHGLDSLCPSSKGHTIASREETEGHELGIKSSIDVPTICPLPVAFCPTPLRLDTVIGSPILISPFLEVTIKGIRPTSAISADWLLSALIAFSPIVVYGFVDTTPIISWLSSPHVTTFSDSIWSAQTKSPFFSVEILELFKLFPPT